MDVFVSTYPFGADDPQPRILLDDSSFSVSYNELSRKLTVNELINRAGNTRVLLAGTENLMPFLEQNPNLEMISRVGIGLDGVPLSECKRRGIRVSFTPDAVTMAVVELTIGLMLSASRHVGNLDRKLREGKWSRPSGRRIEHSVIGLFGLGRIGSQVARILTSFQPKEVLIHDNLDKSEEIQALRIQGLRIRQVKFEDLLTQSNLLSIHVPLYKKTRHQIGLEELKLMPSGSVLINTARGGIVEEEGLATALQNGILASAAVDVFELEPYQGPFTELENLIITPHIGSCSYDCRLRMEKESAEEALRHLQGKPLLREVSAREYEYQL
jgi:D-3-phosphoglycerate dehydrogenase